MSTTQTTAHRTTKVPEVSRKPLPVRPYDRTEEENKKIADAELNTWKVGLKARKEPPPKQVFTEKQYKWTKSMLE